ncbi:hypothetical protein V4V60_004074 [Vibrio mimicus]
MSVEEKNTVKIRKQHFLRKEILVYLSQIYLFFWSAFLSSGSLSNEELLVKYLESVINERSVLTLFYAVLASVITLGTIEFLAKGFKSSENLKMLSSDIAASVGRTMYFFGSSISGGCLAVAVFRFFNPGESTPNLWFFLSLSTGFIMFLYGYFITLWCNRVSLNNE